MLSSGFQVLFSPGRRLRSRLDMHGSAWEGRTKTGLVVTERKGGVLKSSASDFSGKYHNFLMHLPRVRKADCVQRDKDGCQLSLQPVPVASLAQRPGSVRAESPLRVMITSHLC